MEWTQEMVDARRVRQQMSPAARMTELMAGRQPYSSPAFEAAYRPALERAIVRGNGALSRYHAAMTCPSRGSHLSPGQRAAYGDGAESVRQSVLDALGMASESATYEARQAAGLAYTLAEYRAHVAECARWSAAA